MVFARLAPSNILSDAYLASTLVFTGTGYETEAGLASLSSPPLVVPRVLQNSLFLEDRTRKSYTSS